MFHLFKKLIVYLIFSKIYPKSNAIIGLHGRKSVGVLTAVKA